MRKEKLLEKKLFESRYARRQRHLRELMRDKDGLKKSINIFENEIRELEHKIKCRQNRIKELQTGIVQIDRNFVRSLKEFAKFLGMSTKKKIDSAICTENNFGRQIRLNG